jgi:hypothetical protein
MSTSTTIKQTGGGKFDRSESRQGAKFFFASVFSHIRNLDVPDSMPNILLPVHGLVGLGEVDRQVREVMLDSDEHQLLVDSGAFTLAHEYSKRWKVSLDTAFAADPVDLDGFDELMEDYRSFITANEERIWGYVELDLGGTEKKRQLRHQMEAEGLRPIPVFHPLTDPWEYFSEIVAEYDRVCVGNVVALSHQMRTRLLHRLYRDWKQTNPDCWIHILGMTPTTNAALSLPFSSYDSSTWTTAFRWRVQMNCLALGTVRSGFLPPYMHWPPGSSSEIVKKMSEYAICQYYSVTRGNAHYLAARRDAL